MVTNFSIIFEQSLLERNMSDPRFRKYGCVNRALEVVSAVQQYYLSRCESPAPAHFPENIREYLMITTYEGFIFSRHLDRARRVESTISLAAGHYANVIIRLFEDESDRSSHGLNVNAYDEHILLCGAAHSIHPDDPKRPKSRDGEDSENDS